jgi:four helix bundle protein
MSGYKELEIYKLAYALAIKVHKATLNLPKFEIHEQGGQIRRSTKSIRDTIVEGYGRRMYKAEYIRFLIFAQASCDEATNQAIGIIDLYPELGEFTEIHSELDILGRKINNYIKYVETSWRT